MMRSKRFPDDTLFFIMEEDLQFYDVLKDRGSGGTAVAEPSAATAAAGSAAPRSPIPEPSAGIGDLFANGRAVDDLVKIASAAHRAGVGDLVWFSFVPDKAESKKDWSSPKHGFGSAGIMCTKSAAASILNTFSSGFWKPNHIDMELKRWAFAETPQCPKASWLWPPVGNFGTHASECCFQQVGIRSTGWGLPWVTVGVRPSDDVKQEVKHLYKFVKSRWQQVVKTIPEDDFCSWSLWWNSKWADPVEPSAQTERQRRELRRQRSAMSRRWYVDSEAEVPGGSPATAPCSSPHQHAQHKKKHPYFQFVAKASSKTCGDSHPAAPQPPADPSAVIACVYRVAGPVSPRHVAEHGPIAAEA